MEQKSDQQDIPERSFAELFSGEIPDIRSQTSTITPEEIDAHLSYLSSCGVQITQEGKWINSGFRTVDGRLVINLPNATPAAKLHEFIHIQHMLEAKKAGKQTNHITACPPYQKALDEIIASTAAISFLERFGGSVSEIRFEAINFDLSLRQLKDHGIENLTQHFGVDFIHRISVNPYLWNL